jgi:hypothetical protein
MLYVRLEHEKPAVALQEVTHDLPAGVAQEIAINLWHLDDDNWELVTEDGRGAVMDDPDKPMESYGVRAEDLLLLRRPS